MSHVGTLFEKGKKADWTGGHKQTTIWQIDKSLRSETGHSTQKPIDCMRSPILNHDSEYVYDPFCGSGTTVIAAEMSDRKCLAIEINPIYCDVIIERYQQFTGKEATRG